MSRRFLGWLDDYDLSDGFEAGDFCEPLGPWGDTDRCVQLLSPLASDYFEMQELRRVLGSEFDVPVSRYNDQQVVEQAARLLAQGRLSLSPRERGVPPAVSVETPQSPPRSREQAVVGWIKFHVVDESDRPVSGVKLDIKKTTGAWTEASTDPDGLIEIRGMPSGSCEARCDLVDATIDNTLAVVEGETTATGEATPIPDTGEPWWIAIIDEHRVKSGETLARLAAGAGVSPDALAFFNWRTRNQEEVAQHLCNEVGCTKLGADGSQFVFDDSDEPGRLYVPRPWKRAKLATEMTHRIRVRRPTKSGITGHVWVQFLSVFDHPVPRVPCSVVGGGKTWLDLKTSDEGEVHWADLPLDDYAVHLRLGSRNLDVRVPWARDELAPHYERVGDLEQLLGGIDDPHGVQVRLLGLGYDPGAIDGIVGLKTRAALETFREHQSLPQTGLLEPEALEVLADLYGA